MGVNFSEREKLILKFWQDNKIFEKLRKKNQGKKTWSFLDGPITANNPMGVHHAWGRSYKDLFQRYRAMRGFDQRFQNGFDCQGLWVEVEVEKELGFRNKRDIEKYGLEKFVNCCKERVKKYAEIQTKQSIRLGQWMDWQNSYYTMSDENNYAIWHFLKECWKKGLLYKGRDAVAWCPRCGTAISQHEILTEDYKEVTHHSVFLKYPIVGAEKEFLLVWTTTPWTLPGNTAIAVEAKKDYVLAEGEKGERYYLLENIAESLGFKIIRKIKGEELVGLKYESPFEDLPRVKESLGGWLRQTVATDQQILPVSETEGTGLVHLAPGSGREDFQLGRQLGIPAIELIDESAVYLDGLADFSGENAKDNPEIIIDYLKNKDNGKYLFRVEPISHRYPVCWRCKSELVWRLVDEWYISMDKLREPLMEATKKIKWIPSFGLERELDWLKNMQDWLISKKRYWGLALPIFECDQCGHFEVIGSKKELEERAVEGWDKFKEHSPHRPWVDEVKIKCPQCGRLIGRISDVGNPWLDAGIVSFSTTGYLTDKDYWRKWFPADFICESFPGQFKNWFYSLIIMSVVLEGVPPTKTIFGYASVHDENDEEMHKSKGNAIWFDEAVEEIGADIMRWLYARQNPTENLRFGFKAADEVRRKILTLYNSIEFFRMYALTENCSEKTEPSRKHILDRWIISRLNGLIGKVRENLDNFNAMSAVLVLEDFFINDLSLWYIRRSRKRFQNNKDQSEREAASSTLYFVLINLLKMIAPIMPFFAEDNYQRLPREGMPESIHLTNWPEANEEALDKELEKEMEKTREIVVSALSERAKAGIKVRQPLPCLTIPEKISPATAELIKEEVNVKEIIFGSELKLDTEITPELEEEGIIREIVRHIQQIRKKKELKPKDEVAVQFFGSLSEILKKRQKSILEESNIKNISFSDEAVPGSEEIEINKKKLSIFLEKI